MACEEYKVRTRNLAGHVRGGGNVIRRWRVARIIPNELTCQENPGATVWFREEAVYWVQLAEGIRGWSWSEVELGGFFDRAIDQVGNNLELALEELQKARRKSGNLKEMQDAFFAANP